MGKCMLGSRVTESMALKNKWVAFYKETRDNFRNNLAFIKTTTTQ